MKRFFFALVALCALTAQVSAQKKYGEIKADTAKVRYVRNMDKAQSLSGTWTRLSHISMTVPSERTSSS